MLSLAIPLNEDTVSPGFLGFGVFLALAAATWLLIRSMNKHIKKIDLPKEADLKQQRWERAEAARAERAEGAERGVQPEQAANAGPVKAAADPAKDDPT